MCGKPKGSSKALAPAFYALGQHDALVQAVHALQTGETLAAFLDDLYVIAPAQRARQAADIVSGCLEDLRGAAPPGLSDLGADV